MRTNRTTRALGALSITLALTLSACGGDESADDHNDADVAFASGMIPHHTQALEMVEMTEGRPLDPEVQALAEDIRQAQAPEIETMSGWLEQWGEDVPDTAGATDDMAGMAGMEGMMSAEDMTALGDAPDVEFGDLWLEMMIEHHTGAVTMAEAEQDEGGYQPAIDLAGAIIESQSAEIEVMESLLS